MYIDIHEMVMLNCELLAPVEALETENVKIFSLKTDAVKSCTPQMYPWSWENKEIMSALTKLCLQPMTHIRMEVK